MKLLNAIAIIVLANVGLGAQTYTERLQAAQPEIEKLLKSMEYKEVITKIKAILPPTIPEFTKDEVNPAVGMASLQEFGAIRSFHVYLGQAYVMAGDLEKAIDNFRKAEEVANVNASEIDVIIAPAVGNWNKAYETAQQGLEFLESFRKQKEELEAKGKKASKQEKDVLKKITENESKYAESAPEWEAMVERAPVILEQLSQLCETTKSEATRFAPAIADLQQDLKSEKETIESKFAGDKVKYVESVIETTENLASLKSVADKVKFLNRLLFLDPSNKAVQGQLNTILGKS
ncbi:MAG: hypothetical protein FWG02_03230 [Holophagaceae bacterium]|nr:hypothetical protein [Holophagaceae bacterium]